MNIQPVKVFFDLMPDNTVSVLVQGSAEWDLMYSYQNMVSWCESEFLDFELVDITNTTYLERISLGVFE
ncbi:hypothetical protein [Vibrio sp. MACH09]|uniref:hypothetical protein n=1 Tax=Vibrio sp. MACH09 TaxID=3025122 RepID=UPI00295F2016|nr:hypothetical protein [Vibrio sp. MACH09]